MANYNTLKAAIQQVIKANGNNEITGDLLQQSLLAMVNSLGAGYQFVGGATTATNPGTPDNNVFYLATEKGTYTNFGGIVVGDEIALLAWNGAWSKTSMEMAGSPNAVLFTPQELTNEQKAQARANIGAIIPWRAVIEPSDDTPYVAIQLSGGRGCILAIDSVGDNSFHGILNISDVEDITAASFVGGGGIDTDENVVIGYDDDAPPRLMVAFKTFGDQSIVLTCLAGTPPALAFDVDVNVVLNPTDSIPWTQLDGAGGVFWATYGTTTVADINAAIADGKAVMMKYNGKNYYYAFNYYFVAYNYPSALNLAYILGGSWFAETISLENITNKMTDIPENRDSETYYPNTKGVFDLTSKWGVISQTQTWTRDADGGYHYNMSNLQRGAIPRANIDLFESAGAVFNATSGYFELNGLTDISYEEMKAIYNYAQTAPGYLFNRYTYAKIRTNLPDAWFGTVNPNSKFKYDPNGNVYANSWVYLSDIEVALLPPPMVGTSVALKPNFCNNLARDAYRIKKIVNVLDITGYSLPADVFYNAYSLEDFQLYGLSVSTNATYGFVHCPRISPASVAYMINNVGTTNNIVITLHATAYARANADADVQAALSAHTNVSLASA